MILRGLSEVYHNLIAGQRLRSHTQLAPGFCHAAGFGANWHIRLDSRLDSGISGNNGSPLMGGFMAPVVRDSGASSARFVGGDARKRFWSHMRGLWRST